MDMTTNPDSQTPPNKLLDTWRWGFTFGGPTCFIGFAFGRWYVNAEVSLK